MNKMANPISPIAKSRAPFATTGNYRQKQMTDKTPTTKIIHIADYNGEHVDKSLFEKALDFLIFIKHNPDSPTIKEEYVNTIAATILEYAKAKAIVRKFGEQITPQTPQHMKDIRRSIVNAPQYSNDPTLLSIATAVINRTWQGIGNWKS